jgi:uncharacterized membrane protein YsdA (DUF1294 family)
MEYLYLIWLSVLGLITFIAYGFDKSRARRRGWRVPEKTLHWLSLLGGVIGGWAGRAFFRHKTQKPVFTLVLLLATLIHAGIVYLLFFRG